MSHLESEESLSSERSEAGSVSKGELEAQADLANQASFETASRDIITAAALDSEFYGKFFFPTVYRQASPEFHKELDDVLERPENRNIAIEAYRGSAKTTKLRSFTTKRIAYGISHTILFISDTEGHAVKSVEWIKNQVEYNYKWNSAFKLSKGKKWSETEIEILHGVEKYPVRVLGLGITGQVRGINIDSFRPDLIIVDDGENEENASTPENRKKLSDLFFGAIEKSLVPSSENPDAKIIDLQTPLNRDALIEVLRRDPFWVSRRYGCFNTDGTSRWETRYPTKELLAQKQSHIARNQLSLWMREMECKVITQETATFKAEWLQYWDTLPEGATYYLAIDPAPPRSDKALASNANTDYQAVVVIAVYADKIFLAEYSNVRDQNPDELAMEFFRLVVKYNPIAVGVETTAYQKVLAWFLKKAMEHRRHYIPIREISDRRRKDDRIRQAISNKAFSRRIYVNRSHSEFIQQFVEHPDVSHDDLLDAFSMAVDLVFPAEIQLPGFIQASEISGPKRLPLSFQGAP